MPEAMPNAMPNDDKPTRARTKRIVVAAVVILTFFSGLGRWLETRDMASLWGQSVALWGRSLVMIGILGPAALVSAVAPRWVGHGIAFGVAASALVAGVAAFMANLPAVLGVTLIIMGAAVPVLAYQSLHRSRAAWSTLTAILAVLGIVTLFGAPKLRKGVGIQLATALIAPGLLAIAVMALSAVRGDYRERG